MLLAPLGNYAGDIPELIWKLQRREYIHSPAGMKSGSVVFPTDVSI
jgi:hypothetical protein